MAGTNFDHIMDECSNCLSIPSPARFAIISRHVVLFTARVPVFAVVLIEGDHIADIVECDELKTVGELLDKFKEWNPIDCEHYCVSPGLIDLNVSGNGDWEGPSHLTMAAVAGGTTFCIESESLYNLPTVCEPLYCDLAVAHLVQPSDLESQPKPTINDCIALKAYMYSPTSMVSGVKDCLDAVFSLAEAHSLPLLLDPSRPDPRMLHMASPCRHLSLEEREGETCFPESSSYASAFAEDLDPMSLSESESETKSPAYIHSDFSSPGLGKSPNFLTATQNAEAKTNKTPVIPLNRELPEFPYVHLPGRKSPPRYKTLLEDLEHRIEVHVSSIKELNRLEMLAYTKAGPTTYNSRTRRASVEVSSEFPKRMHRPSLRLMITQAHVQEAKERMYMFFLANHPDHWESNGVEMVLRALKARLALQASGCRLHFCNLSSALSVSKMLSLPKTSPVTCETCPHYLFFSASDIADGDTRMKSLPPIRANANRTLLWDLLKTNQIHLVSSHHSPIAPKYKYLETGKWKKSLNGLNAIGFTLQSLWTILRSEAESRPRYLVRIAKWCSFNPAQVLGLEDIRGSIAIGKLADLVVWDPEACNRGVSYSKYPQMSPYHDKELYGKVILVVVRGRVAFDNGQFEPVGQRWRR